nr:UDP-glycosyltransferase [Nicotiana tabacum]
MLIGTSTNKSQDMKSIIDKIKQSQDLARGTLINTFEELEPWYIDEYKKIMNKVFCIGPVSLCNKEMVDRGNKICIDEHSCLSWLDSMKPKSVIYACFGSLCQISSLQMKEIGLGLESSNVPFIWVIRKLNLTLEVEKWLRDENFEEKVKGRGMIIRGWAPQVLILSHLSIGGFLTHCGWNSTLEGIFCGVPMITFPMFAEQFYNEKFIVNVLKIGVRVGVEVSINSWNEEKNGVLVNKDQVKKAIDQLMDKGLEGEERRKRTKELAHMSKMVIKEEGSSFLNTKLLIEDVMQLLKNKEGEANNVARTM